MNGRDIAQGISQRLQSVYGKNLSPNLIYAQLAHETGNFTSELATQYHNYGGLTQETPNELAQPDGSNYYMSFQSDDDFVNYMADYLNKYEEDGLFNARDSHSYAEALKHGGYFGDTVENYAAGMQNFIGSSPVADFAMMASNAVNPMEPIVEQEDDTEEATFEDKFLDSVYDSVVWGTFRTQAATRNMPDDDTFHLTQEDIDRVQKELGGDYTATLWVCQNAQSNRQLERLIQMKQEDLERRKRIDASDIGFNTAGTILGAALDPINYLPVFGAAGKLGSVARYAKLAAATAVVSVAERGLTQAATGYKQDYPMAALLGAVAGAGIPAALDLVGKGARKTKELGRKLYGEAINASEDADKLAKGEKLSNTTITKYDFVKALETAHDKKFVHSVKDAEIGGQLRPKHGVYVVSKDDARRIVNMRGYDFDDNAKAFFDDESGLTVLVKENLSGYEDIRRTLLHERGAHGLKYVLSENDYNKVLAELKFRINNNPSPAIERAVKRAGGTADVEEVLGYLAEELKPSNPLMRNISKAMNKGLNKLGFKGRLSDDDFIDILTKGSKHYAEGQKGYRVLKDGSCVYQGIHYSKKNLLNPEMMDKADNLLKGLGTKLVKKVARWGVFATPHSIAATSKSKTFRDWSSKFVRNPWQNEVLTEVPAETYKDAIRNDAQVFFNRYYEARDKALVKLQHFSADAKQEYNDMVIRYFNKEAGNKAGVITTQFPPEIVEGAKALKELREYLRNVTMHPEQYIGEGYGILPPDYKVLDDEFYRWVDDGKFAQFITSFKNKKEAQKALKLYAHKAVKRDIVRQQIEDRLDREWRIGVEQAKKKGTQVPERPSLTDEQFEVELDKLEYEWATGMTDRGVSKVYQTANTTIGKIGDMDFLKYRLPMDTSLEIVLPNGNAFSFDNNMRSYDIDSFLPMIINRTSGEIALTTKMPKSNKMFRMNPLGFEDSVSNNLDGLRQQIEAELKEQVQLRQITKDDIRDDLKAFDFEVNRLRGMPIDENPDNLLDAASRTMNTYAYARNSGNMVFNQLGELNGSIAYAGMDAIFDLFPYLRRMVTETRLGKGSEDMLQEAVLDTFGESAQKYVFGNAYTSASRVYRDILNDTKISRALDTMSGLINTSANAITKLTGFHELTMRMINSVQKQTLIDVARWVNGTDFPKYRNPFSDGKLKAAGLVGESNIRRFREALKPYMKLDSKGRLIDMDVKKLHTDDPHLFMQYYVMVDNQTRRCITMPSIGNSNMKKESSPFWRVFFMFKDFTMRATHSQSMRIAMNHEADDILATAYSMATNLAVVCGLAYARSKFVINKDNEYKHKKYMEQYTNPGTLAYTAIMRSNIIGSPLTYFNDALEVTGKSPVASIRTTTNRYTRPKGAEEMLGGYLMQLPAIKGAYDIVDATAGAAYRDEYTQRDLNKLLQLMPGQNILPIMYLRDELVKDSGLPRR